ncbi:MAG: DUF3488 and DUF4129 domain-containing transglutaminase family protein [Candidatus Promineifilaceae bacterium]
MLYDVASWGWRRFRPREGWLSYFLLLAVILTLTYAVIEVAWVPEMSVLPWLSIIGLMLGTLLANRPLKWFWAWIVISAYGLLLNAALLGQMFPLSPFFSGGWSSGSELMRQNFALLLDRIGGWYAAVSSGGSSKETIVFALILGLTAWFLAAFAGWSTFRQRRPLVGLTVMGIAVAINGYFGDAPLWPIAFFVGLSAILAASIHYANLEREWSDKQIDFSTEIRLDTLGISAGIALFLLTFAYVLPAINIRAFADIFTQQPVVQEAEDAFDRAFAGVRQPRQESPPINLEGNPGRGGTLPRSFLIGAPPELYETVVFTASTGSDPIPLTHWRGYSYDQYTGRGWSISNEREETIPAGDNIALPPDTSALVINQEVHWIQAPLSTRYTLGLPERFDQDVVAYWRGVEDLSRVKSGGQDYSAVSRVSSASTAELRNVSLSDVPPAVLARYTALPSSVPDRVIDLAQQIGGSPNFAPFDKAKALERFLRQYPYSLEVTSPPPGSDPVDYFLFELQTGYCDYYASAMVIMARALGLPARLTAGFLAQPPGDDGTQTIYQINAHSWPEIYFAGYGWIEFEPTASFPTSDRDLIIPIPPGFNHPEPLPLSNPPPIPAQEVVEVSPFWYLLGVLLLFMAAWWIWSWRRKRTADQNPILWAYGRLMRSASRLGASHQPSQTPAEFEALLIGDLNRPARPNWSLKWRKEVQPDIIRLSSLFAAQRYSGKQPAPESALDSWNHIRLRMWFLGVLNRLFEGSPKKKEQD